MLPGKILKWRAACMSKIFQHRDEALRYIIEQAVAKGKSLQSNQTGFLHYFYHSQENGDQAIPFVENMYFALALLRSKTADQMKEAKSFLEKLLAFYAGVEKNFPIYLHEYPQCKDRYLGAHLLPIFYWILKDYHTILGKDLQDNLAAIAKALAENLIETFQIKPPPYHLAVKCAASWIALGTFLNVPHLVQEGQTLLDSLKDKGISLAWGDPHCLADILSSLQMIYPSIANSPWGFFWNYLIETWHSQTNCYTGPARKVYQAGFQPEAGLYDLYFGYFSQAMTFRLTGRYPHELLGVLIQPSDDSLDSTETAKQGSIGHQNWFLIKKPAYAYSLLENDPQLDPSQYNGYHFLRFLWGSPEAAHTLVCQKNKSIVSVSYERKNDSIECFITLEPPNEENGNLNNDVAFYCDLPSGKIFVDGIQATSFNLNNGLNLKSSSLNVSMQFALIEGEGIFFGHIHRANRPSQILNKGDLKYEAFDHHIFIRSIKRSPLCRLKVTIGIENNP